MKWIGRQFRKLVRLGVMTFFFTALVIVLDAMLSPDGDDVRPGS